VQEKERSVVDLITSLSIWWRPSVSRTLLDSQIEIWGNACGILSRSPLPRLHLCSTPGCVKRSVAIRRKAIRISPAIRYSTLQVALGVAKVSRDGAPTLLPIMTPTQSYHTYQFFHRCGNWGGAARREIPQFRQRQIISTVYLSSPIATMQQQYPGEPKAFHLKLL
jgi:hypothetical protein